MATRAYAVSSERVAESQHAWWVAPAGCDQRPCPVQMVALGESNPPISLRLSLVTSRLSDGLANAMLRPQRSTHAWLAQPFDHFISPNAC